MKIQRVYCSPDVWRLLERVLRESRQYRGETDVRFADLQKLAAAIEKRKKKGSGPRLNPQGGTFRCEYPFKPAVWKGWQDKIGSALAIASTDSKRNVPSVGVPQGGTVMKRNYGGRVFYQPGQVRAPSGDMLGSAMDRYDVVMVGDVVGDDGQLVQVAYAPSIGDIDDRRARLEDLLAGRSPSATRRVQPDIPDAPASNSSPAQPVPRVGQNVRTPPKDD